MGLFDGGQMGRVLEELCRHAEMVLLDSPALGEHGDALLTGSRCDGVLLVWEPASASRQQVQQACRLLAASGVRPSGVICNKVAAGWADPAAYRYYYCYLPESRGHLPSRLG